MADAARITDGDPRVERRPSRTTRGQYRCGSVYLTVDEGDAGEPFRVLLRKGHVGMCQQALLGAVGRLLTIMLQETDIPRERLWHTLVGTNCGEGMIEHLSCLDDLARMLWEKDDNQPARG